jgi:hypothetical protein
MERIYVRVAPPVPVIQGWLLALCIGLTIIFPASTLYGVAAKTIPALLHGHTIKGQLSCASYAVLFSGVAVFSFVAGVRLWTVKPEAVGFAKRFLWTFLLAHFGYFALWFLLFEPVSALRLAEMAWYHIVGPIPSFFLWTVYLEHSKRVRATYEES